MKRIMCYGDSNTFGYDARRYLIDGTTGRYDENTRWTGLLAKKLGSRYQIIEEGFCGRTTVFEDSTAYGRNGFPYTDIAFGTHDPLDLILIMLGTNDVKDMFAAQPLNIANGMERLIVRFRELISESLNPETGILIIAPPPVTACADGSYLYGFSAASEEKGKKLAGYYRKLAEKYHCLFADAGEWIRPDASDGTHFSPEGHAVFAEHAAGIIQNAVRC